MKREREGGSKKRKIVCERKDRGSDVRNKKKYLPIEI